jgi:hypothetical protein
MLGFPAHLPSIRTDSLPRPSSPSGNAIFQGRDKGLEMTPEIQLTDYGYKMRARNPPVRGLFAHREEISASNKTVWWGWEDSNLMPARSANSSLARCQPAKPVAVILSLPAAPSQTFSPASTVVGQIAAGKLRALATATHKPARWWQSAWLTPAATMRIKTSPGFGVGTGRFSGTSTSGPPGLLRRREAARTHCDCRRRNCCSSSLKLLLTRAPSQIAPMTHIPRTNPVRTTVKSAKIGPIFIFNRGAAGGPGHLIESSATPTHAELWRGGTRGCEGCLGASARAKSPNSAFHVKFPSDLPRPRASLAVEQQIRHSDC